MPFAGHLLSQGQDGGYRAAQILSDSIDFHIAHSPCRLWVTVLFSNSIMMDLLVKAGVPPANVPSALQDFVAGFNDFCETFTMADVGNGPEAVSCRIAGLSL